MPALERGIYAIILWSFTFWRTSPREGHLRYNTLTLYFLTYQPLRGASTLKYFDALLFDMPAFQRGIYAIILWRFTFSGTSPWEGHLRYNTLTFLLFDVPALERGIYAIILDALLFDVPALEKGIYAIILDALLFDVPALERGIYAIILWRFTFWRASPWEGHLRYNTLTLYFLTCQTLRGASTL